MTTRSSIRRLGAAVAAAAALTVITPGAAYAGTTSFDDPVETTNPEDIVRVSVTHAPRILTVRIKQQSMDQGGTDLPIHAVIAISTGPQYKGPEWLIEQAFYTEGGPNLRRTEGWSGPRGPFKDCIADLRWNATKDVIRFSVPRRCIGRPSEVRVNVTYRFFEPVGARTVDHAPGRRVMGPATAI
jgi:hypothetical protein